MELHLTPDQQAFLHRAVATGRYSSEAEALRDAMQRWEEGERTRIELLSAFDDAEADLADGRYDDYAGDASTSLTEALKREARAERDAHHSA